MINIVNAESVLKMKPRLSPTLSALETNIATLSLGCYPRLGFANAFGVSLPTTACVWQNSTWATKIFKQLKTTQTN
jgi:hypothetical protein